MKRENLRDAYPSLFAFGDSHRFLTPEEAVVASVEDRIRSIWPFLVRRVLNFQARLKPRERTNFDAEDTVSELYIALAERDSGWIPERGAYITYAGTVIDHELCSIRDKSRTVHSPRNSSCRLKEYQLEEDLGTITEGRRKTANDIKRTVNGLAPIDAPGVPSPSVASKSKGPDELAMSTEESKESAEALKDAIQGLGLTEASVIGKLCGLWGQKPRTVFEVAFTSAMSASDVRRFRDQAFQKIQGHFAGLQVSA